jgi:hypothetical protein
MPETYTVVEVQPSPCVRCGTWHRVINTEGRVILAWCDCPEEE